MNKNYTDKNQILKWLGNNLRKARKAKGYSQMAVSEIAQVDYSYYGAVERGEKAITVKKLWQITNALQIPLVEMFEHEPSTDNYKPDDIEKQKVIENIMMLLQKQSFDDLIFIHDIILKMVNWRC